MQDKQYIKNYPAPCYQQDAGSAEGITSTMSANITISPRL